MGLYTKTVCCLGLYIKTGLFGLIHLNGFVVWVSFIITGVFEFDSLNLFFLFGFSL